jgi:hypothetical protein
MGLLCTIAAGARQPSHSQVRVPRESWPLLMCQIRDPPPGGPGLRTYIPQEQGGPVITPRHWVPFSSDLNSILFSSYKCIRIHGGACWPPVPVSKEPSVYYSDGLVFKNPSPLKSVLPILSLAMGLHVTILIINWIHIRDVTSPPQTG